AIQALKDLHQEYKLRDNQIAISNPNQLVLLTLARSGTIDLIGKEWYFVRVHDAVRVCLQQVQNLNEFPKKPEPSLENNRPGHFQKLLKERTEDFCISQLESGNLQNFTFSDDNTHLEPPLLRKC
ncbi:sulfate transporter, chloroplastic-like, partial [Olea europaea subsp. europaea]